MNIQTKLDKFATFEDGWNCNDGVVFDKQVLDLAKIISDYCESIGYDEQEVFPGTSGNILLSVYSGEDEIEIEIDDNLQFLYIYWKYEDTHMDEYDCGTSNLEVLKTHILKIRRLTINE